MLNRLQKSMQEKDKGFTLIELLVVVVIIGILAAVAIPVFLKQREKAADAATKSDLKNAASLMETFFVDNGTYPTDVNSATDLPDLKKSNGVSLAGGGDATSFCIDGTNTGGSDGNTAGYFWYDSAGGGLQYDKTGGGGC